MMEPKPSNHFLVQKMAVIFTKKNNRIKEFMERSKLCLLLFGILSFAINLSQAQTIEKKFHPDSLSHNSFSDLEKNCGKNKILPATFEKQTLIALSYYPELKDVKIKFRIKHKTTPLATRPSYGGMLRSAKKRTYIITISNKSRAFLDTILLKNLNYNAQIGVLGHELSHVSDFAKKGFGGMCKVVFGHLSKNYVDHFEFNTDRRCIDHGLGYQLLAWSINVRENLKSSSWKGAETLSLNTEDERYMNPGTIEKILANHPLYQKK
ncbi:hypothetical protein BH11BAC2_BH11BAC2_21800 [soil metagenome]